MEIFEAIPKEWGNSLGITIPKEVIRKEHIKSRKKIRFLVIGEGMNKIKQAFGSLKLRKPTQTVMDEIDKEYN